ncbi:hypothetical protein EYZ11_002039 [Aspergillus tanneri]|uniref:Uncharacterized protein n=1 Tax=Aspergillus tanneri TaxID=1220188 RepID=A0A4V3UQB7_9EURO|nr:uncharacterized protein ATNIH1004_007302 [Aspergillus tanneri]KAA8645881.1 hypothetical protein ATNIH1004_007302 [Aspergillus tanneri]THC98454.1 hypothetical protein EYZ11_002039 [Aspergillus tanneri]
MSYKTNYEPYTSQSLDMPRDRSSKEILYPLGALYPHVVALQLQADDNPWCQTARFSDVNYWADISSPQSPIEDYSRPRPTRRNSDSTALKFVSRIRRLLSRDEMKRRHRHA